MTKEEAVQVLDDMKVKIDIPKAAKMQNDRNSALDMAITALSNPCTDAVSREAAIDYVKSYIHEIVTESGTDKNEHTNNILRMIVDGLNEFPPVQPTQEWIPVSERLPEKDVECMVVYCSEGGVVGTCMYYNAFNQYKGTNHPETAFDDIVAWMPIEPYNA